MSEDKQQKIKENLKGILKYIGDDPEREGLLKTPARIVRSWDYRVPPEFILHRIGYQ